MIPNSWAGPIAVVDGIRRRVAECASCERTRPILSRGLCRSCKDRHLLDGALEEFGYLKADRMTDYEWLTRQCGELLPAAAARIGISERTAWRYEKQLRTDPTTEREAA